MDTTLERGTNLDRSKTPLQQDPQRSASSGPEDGTLNSNHHDVHRSHQDAGVLRKAKGLPKTTATPGAILSSAPQCTSNSSRPLHLRHSGRRRRLPIPSYMYSAPPCVYKRRRRDLISSGLPLAEHTLAHSPPILALASIT